MSDTERITFFLLKSVARACKEFDLLVEGDRVAVAVSGGKDSRALLELLLRYRERTPFAYRLVALHVDGTAAGFPDLRPELVPWFQSLGVDYRVIPLDLPADEPLPLDCFRCSWNRRRALFTAAVGLDCNKLAFGHHADDAAATVLLNLMFGGRLETITPRVQFFDGMVTVIRPLIYLPEKELARYARARGLDTPALSCPQGSVSKRAQVKGLLRQFGREQGQIRANLWRVARRAMEF
ncbi:MAG TPA: tRNA 2-thiocytidine biosynthesis protein TtcA [Chloroflexi bacterium]|nr:tRNA 2-thiocytidine biosynthesis protein TtcA [Chloroflexota bacterium]